MAETNKQTKKRPGPPPTFTGDTEHMNPVDYCHGGTVPASRLGNYSHDVLLKGISTFDPEVPFPRETETSTKKTGMSRQPLSNSLKVEVPQLPIRRSRGK